MALTLILMRHAKSSWGDPGLDDFDRPLNERGRRGAARIGAWLVRKGYLPDEVLVSGARRTVETWERMADRFPRTASMRSDPALYMASARTLLGVLKSRSAPTVMIIAHNPGIADFARQMASVAPDHERFADYPTAATTVMTFDADGWCEVGAGRGVIRAFAVPRDLEPDQ